MTTKTIKLKIHEEADLFSEYDPDRKMLSEDISAYLARNFVNKHRSSREEYILHICSDMPLDQDSVRTRFAEYYSQEREVISYSLKRLTFRQIYLLIVGVAALSLWFFLSLKTDNAVRLEIISIIGWVAIWEAASIAIMQRPDLIRLRRTYDRFINARIIIDVNP